MPNRNYVRGRNKEYKIVQELKNSGFEIAQRTAGSHSPIDVFAINREAKLIKFIQAKPDHFPKSEGDKIKRDLDYLNGNWRVEFELR